MKKLIAGVFLVFTIAGAIALPPRAHAQFVVTDPGHTAATIGGWAEEAINWIYERAIKFVLERLKKRLLDTVTDQIIAWIQYGTEPQFLSDFGGVFTDAADAAVGDALIQNGLGRFCSPNIGPLLNLTLRQARTRFSTTPACTLTQVVQSADAFARDFAAGGWLGLQTISNPENNRYGQFIVMSEQLQRSIGAKQQAAQTEAQASAGFTSAKRCLRWTHTVDAGGYYDEETLSPGDAEWDDLYYGLENYPNGDNQWYCKEEDRQIITPAEVVKEGASRAIYSDIDYLLGSTELTSYLGAIADAAFNRLTSDAYAGLRGMMRSQTTNPTAGGPPPHTAPPAVIEASSTYSNQLLAGAEQNRQSLLSRVNATLADAQGDLPSISGLRGQIAGLIEGMGAGYGYSLVELDACLDTCPGLDADKAWVDNASSTAWAASTTLARLENNPTRSIAETIAALLPLQTRLMALAGTNFSVADLSALNTQALTTALANHAAIISIRGFLQETLTSIPNRLLYCTGDQYRTPPINMCTPYSSQ